MDIFFADLGNYKRKPVYIMIGKHKKTKPA